MSAILHGFSINTSGSPRRLAQRDTEAYWRRLLSLGGTDINSNDQVQNVQEFLAGAYDIVPRQSFNSWQLRSTQSAGTGSIAVPVGGFPDRRGTLVNGPVHSADGLVFDRTASQRVTFPNNSFGVGAEPFTAIIFLRASLRNARQIALSCGNQNSNTDSFTLEVPEGAGSGDIASIAFTNNGIAGGTTTWQSLLIGNTTLGFRGRNGGTVSSFSLLNTLNKSGSSCGIGAMINPSSAHFSGEISCLVTLHATPTTSIFSAIYSLYKSTLGQGLGLP